MSHEDRVRLVLLVDTFLSLSSVEIGVHPRVSFELYHGSPSDAPTDGLTFQVRHNDAAMFDTQVSSLIEDQEIRRLLKAALPDFAVPHSEFVGQMLSPDGAELDLELFRRGLTGTGLDLRKAASARR